MRVRLGCEVAIEIAEAMPVVALLEACEECRRDVEGESGILATPNLPSQGFRDLFGNRRRRFEAPAGRLTLLYDVVADVPEGEPDRPPAWRVARQELPPSVLGFLAGSRHCEVEGLRLEAVKMFGGAAGDAARVEAVCNHVTERVSPNESAAATEAAAHRAIALCRALNIPARYVRGFGGAGRTGFSVWIEAFCDGAWRSFDVAPGGAALGRIAVARGRDAADAPLFFAPGPFRLRGLKTWCYAQDAEREPAPGTRENSGTALRLVA